MLGPKPSEEWFVSEHGAVSGPFSRRRIVDLIRWGRITSGALLCDGYGSAWFPISRSPFAELLVEEGTVQAAARAPQPSAVPAVSLTRAALFALGVAVVAIVAALTA